ncbi:MAG: type IX secretion system membrane protein PorP/SprF [Bacteroidota bacterium]
MKSIYRKIVNACLAIVSLASYHHEGMAQVNPLGSIYYQNQYLANPAMSGLGDEWVINLGYRKQWASFPGAPSTQYISGDYRFADKAAGGLIIFNEKAGLLQSTRIMGTYSYHLPIGEDQTLDVGLSAGMLSEKIDTEALSGDIGDPGVARFNNQGIKLNGDFGVAYRDKKITLQGVLPNIMTFFDEEQKEIVDRSLFFVAASYKFQLTEADGVSFEPKVCFRGVKGADHIIDAGARVGFLKDKFSLFGMYHSSKNITIGAGLTVKDMLIITGLYSSPSSSMGNKVNGNLEAGIQVLLWRKPATN